MAHSCHWKVLPQHEWRLRRTCSPYAICKHLELRKKSFPSTVGTASEALWPHTFWEPHEFLVFTYRDNKFLIQAKQLYNKHREQTAEGKLDRPFLDSSLNTKSTWMAEGLPPASFLFWTRHHLWISASSSFNYTSGSRSHKEHLKIMTSIDWVNPSILWKSLLQQFNIAIIVPN